VVEVNILSGHNSFFCPGIVFLFGVVTVVGLGLLEFWFGIFWGLRVIFGVLVLFYGLKWFCVLVCGLCASCCCVHSFSVGLFGVFFRCGAGMG